MRRRGIAKHYSKRLSYATIFTQLLSPISTVMDVRHRKCGSMKQCLLSDFPLRIISSQEPTLHYNDAIMGAITSQITSLTIVYSSVYSDADQRKHQSSASLAFVREIHRGPVISPDKWPVTRKMFPFDDVIMLSHGRFVTQLPFP